MVSNLSTTNRPPKEAIEKACAMLNKAHGNTTFSWNHGHDWYNPTISTLATLIAERDALIAKYEPKPDPLPAEPEVTQADRDAAAPLLKALYHPQPATKAASVRYAQAFARHRIATEAKIRDALLAKYEPKPDPLLAEADELLAKYWEGEGFTADTIGRARAGKLRGHTHHKAVLFTLQQRDKEI